MKKMTRLNELINILPQVDCGLCGAPSCQDFAEDIVQNDVPITKCVFVQKILQQNEKLDIQEAIDIMKKTRMDKKLDSVKIEKQKKYL
jgi:Na+-translocating ferredoxin:NAD+ oxidoreductase RNF subunit RnfB